MMRVSDEGQKKKKNKNKKKKKKEKKEGVSKRQTTGECTLRPREYWRAAFECVVCFATQCIFWM